MPRIYEKTRANGKLFLTEFGTFWACLLMADSVKIRKLGSVSAIPPGLHCKLIVYAKNQGISRIEGFWCLFGNRGTFRYRQFAHPHVVHLRFLSYTGLSCYRLYDPGFLDQYKKLYPGGKEESFKEFVKRISDHRFTQFYQLFQ